MSWDQLQDQGKASVLDPSHFDALTIASDSSLPRPHTAQEVVQNTYCFSRSNGLHGRPGVLVLGHDWGRVTLWHDSEHSSQKNDSSTLQDEASTCA